MDAYNRLRLAKFLETLPAKDFQSFTLFNKTPKESILRDVRLNQENFPALEEFINNYVEYKK
ncbi:MAG: hypothetical protein ACT4OY_04910 [Alphaproteobacteria bacterium]